MTAILCSYPSRLVKRVERDVIRYWADDQAHELAIVHELAHGKYPRELVFRVVADLIIRGKLQKQESGTYGRPRFIKSG